MLLIAVGFLAITDHNTIGKPQRRVIPHTTRLKTLNMLHETAMFPSGLFVALTVSQYEVLGFKQIRPSPLRSRTLMIISLLLTIRTATA